MAKAKENRGQGGDGQDPLQPVGKMEQRQAARQAEMDKYRQAQSKMPIFIQLPPANRPSPDGEGVQVVNRHVDLGSGEVFFSGKGVVQTPHQGKIANLPIDFPIEVPPEVLGDEAAALHYAFDHLEEAFKLAEPAAVEMLRKQLSPGIVVAKPGGDGKGFRFRGGKETPYQQMLRAKMRPR